MRLYHSRRVLWAWKQRCCDWCADPIEIADEYQRVCWSDGGDSGTIDLHLECVRAMNRASKATPELAWRPGDFKRGSTSPDKLAHEVRSLIDRLHGVQDWSGTRVGNAIDAVEAQLVCKNKP